MCIMSKNRADEAVCVPVDTAGITVQTGFMVTLDKMKQVHHSNCCFYSVPSWMPFLTVSFDDSGTLYGSFTAENRHQGYDGRVHGGVLAALVDASMAQCCMGHGIAGYTADLSLRFRKPVQIEVPVNIQTTVMGSKKVLHTLECRMIQRGNEVLVATGRFYQFA